MKKRSEPMVPERVARDLLAEKDHVIEMLKRDNALLRESHRELLLLYRRATAPEAAVREPPTWRSPSPHLHR